MQENIYRHHSKKEMARLLATEAGSEVSREKGGQSTLKAITRLKKAVNHPALLEDAEIPSHLISPGFNKKECQSQFSGKIYLLDQMLMQIR